MLAETKQHLETRSYDGIYGDNNQHEQANYCFMMFHTYASVCTNDHTCIHVYVTCVYESVWWRYPAPSKINLVNLFDHCCYWRRSSLDHPMSMRSTAPQGGTMSIVRNINGFFVTDSMRDQGFHGGCAATGKFGNGPGSYLQIDPTILINPHFCSYMKFWVEIIRSLHPGMWLQTSIFGAFPQPRCGDVLNTWRRHAL